MVYLLPRLSFPRNDGSCCYFSLKFGIMVYCFLPVFFVSTRYNFACCMMITAVCVVRAVLGVLSAQYWPEDFKIVRLRNVVLFSNVRADMYRTLDRSSRKIEVPLRIRRWKVLASTVSKVPGTSSSPGRLNWALFCSTNRV